MAMTPSRSAFLFCTETTWLSTGMMMSERTPRRWQAAASNRGSVSVSSQCCAVPVARHASATPDGAFSRAATSGAVAPVAARQVILPPTISAIAAPVALVAKRACCTISLMTSSSARSMTEVAPPRPGILNPAGDKVPAFGSPAAVGCSGLRPLVGPLRAKESNREVAWFPIVVGSAIRERFGGEGQTAVLLVSEPGLSEPVKTNLSAVLEGIRLYTGSSRDGRPIPGLWTPTGFPICSPQSGFYPIRQSITESARSRR